MPSDSATPYTSGTPRSRRRRQLMWSYHAERPVAGEPSTVRSVIAALVDELWGDRCRLVLDDGHQRIDAVAVDAGAEEVDVWLTWQVSPHPGGTWVELRLDELERGPDPHSEMGELLDTFAVRVLERPTP